MYYKRKIEARSRDHYCLGKAIHIIYSECICNLSYPAWRAHAPYYTVICGQSCCTTFFHDFRKEVVEPEVSVVIFSTTFIW